MHCMLMVISIQYIWSFASDAKGPCQILPIIAYPFLHYCTLLFRKHAHKRKPYCCTLVFPILAQQYSGFLWILSLRTKVLLLHTDCCLSLHKSTWGSCKSYPCTGNPYCWTLVNPSVGILLDPKTGYTVVSLTCTKSHVGSNKSCPFAHWYFSFLHKSTWVLVHEVAILGMMYAIVGSWCTYQSVCSNRVFFCAMKSATMGEMENSELTRLISCRP